MMHLLRLLMSWSVRRVLLFVLLVAAMVAAVQIGNAYRQLPQLSGEIENLERQQGLLEAEVERQRKQAEAGLRSIERLEEPMLHRRLAEVRAAIAGQEGGRTGGLGLTLGAASGDGNAVARALAGRFRLQLMRREEAVIAARLDSIRRGGQVNGIAARVGILDSRIRVLEQSIAATERRYPLLARIERMPAVSRIEGPWRELRAARQELASARTERQRLAAAYRATRGAFDRAGLAYRQSQAVLRSLPAPTAELGRQIEEKRGRLAGHWANRAWGAVKPVLGWAAWVTLLILVVPPAVKAFWFFVVAPRASNLRPIRIGRPGAGGIGWAGGRLAGEGPQAGSAVSRRLRLRPGEELLVRPEYLQSSVADAEADSQLLLSPALPFGSLATGLVGLTRIRPGKDTSATLSASRDPIDEIGILEIPEGSAVVFRPRNLVGIVKDRGRPLHVERVWRIGCLLSWLILRLRHLVFHGPCALVVKGARGVALEPAAGGRRVADAATMGWSAGLDYSVTRSETFLAYLTGKQSLFHDRFDGSIGQVIYEEMPRARGKSGLFGRGLEGLGDGLLKIAGL
ncbi:MAG TPA: hypothetical protein VE891_07210 [Allosphingosinicella sp.]|nr:hypothetical protein [Allosphingosinicella sp.]